MTTLLVLRNEIHRRFLIIWDYKFDLLMQLMTVALIFIGASFFLGHGQFDTRQVPTMLLGYSVWFYARIVMLESSYHLEVEAQAGMLEQMYMSPFHASTLLVGRMLAMLISATVLLSIPVGALIVLLHVNIPLHWEAVPVLLLILVGLFGFTLILCGAVLVFKQVQTFADLLQNALLFLAGTLVPLSSFPGWLAAIARTLPLAQGIVVLREITFENKSLFTTWANGGIFWLALNSLLYLCIGWLLFKVCERVAMHQGSLGQY